MIILMMMMIIIIIIIKNANTNTIIILLIIDIIDSLPASRLLRDEQLRPLRGEGREAVSRLAGALAETPRRAHRWSRAPPTQTP